MMKKCEPESISMEQDWTSTGLPESSSSPPGSIAKAEPLQEAAAFRATDEEQTARPELLTLESALSGVVEALDDFSAVVNNITSSYTSLSDPRVPSARAYKQLRKPRTDDQKRTNNRMATLDSGRIEASRGDRWAVRRRIAQSRRGEWLLYGLYEHLFDLASQPGPSLEPQAHLYFWELAEDLCVSRSTIKRRIDRLERMGLLRVERATSDCSPNVFTLKGLAHSLTASLPSART